ncbi:MAG TPA: UTP--glucose-1-phosphate uridylyltransferase [Candidatus Binataceae bacterium]|nr:UTP--glucose-1-phosphate uridylyltransferase [Candidatus Binataceae bacterium]
MKVRKAVIVAAGMGTRMLPASKVVPKELLPVVDKPAIQVVVEEAVESGIEEIVLLLGPGKEALRQHFEPAPLLERHLEQRSKRDLLEIVHKTNHLAKFTIAWQNEPLGLGHAVLCAREAVGNESFAVILPDDIFDCPRPCLRQMLDVAEPADAPTVALLRVARSELSKYGIVAVNPAGTRRFELTGMVEKPPIDKAPSEFAIMGRYILTPDIFDLLAQVRPGAGGEIQLTDGLMALAQRRKLYGYEFEGIRYDLGDRVGFLTAQIGFGLKRPELADSLRAWLKTTLAS